MALNAAVTVVWKRHVSVFIVVAIETARCNEKLDYYLFKGSYKINFVCRMFFSIDECYVFLVFR